jgi:hypothetical protein
MDYDGTALGAGRAAPPVPALPNFLRCTLVSGAIVHAHVDCIVMIAEGNEYNTLVMVDGHQLRATTVVAD